MQFLMYWDGEGGPKYNKKCRNHKENKKPTSLILKEK